MSMSVCRKVVSYAVLSKGVGLQIGVVPSHGNKSLFKNSMRGSSSFTLVCVGALINFSVTFIHYYKKDLRESICFVASAVWFLSEEPWLH